MLDQGAWETHWKVFGDWKAVDRKSLNGFVVLLDIENHLVVSNASVTCQRLVLSFRVQCVVQGLLVEGLVWQGSQDLFSHSDNIELVEATDTTRLMRHACETRSEGMTCVEHRQNVHSVNQVQESGSQADVIAGATVQPLTGGGRS